MIAPLQVKKLYHNAKTPVRSTNHAAAYDLYALEDNIVDSRSKSNIRTGIAIRIPQLPPPLRVYGSIRSRSGLSAKHGIEVGAGVIDEDYSGELAVILHNHTDCPFKCSAGDRVGQLILSVYVAPEIVEVNELSELDNDSRGIMGFGSTGR